MRRIGMTIEKGKFIGGVGPSQVFDIANQPPINDIDSCLRTGFLKPKILF
jgi:hypothetical protein